MDKQKQLERLLRRHKIETGGTPVLLDELDKMLDILEAPESLKQLVKGEKGDTPVRGEDYFTEQDIQDFLDAATPVKDVHYFDGEDGKDGEKPVKGKDYFTVSEIKDFLKKATPVKGVHYFTPDEVAAIKEELRGDAGEDGKSVAVEDVIAKLKVMEGEEAASFSKTIGALIDFSHIRNAPVYRKQGKQIDTSDLRWHGAGDTVAAGVGITITRTNGISTISAPSAPGTAVYGEDLTPQTPGTVFTLAHTPIANTVRLYRGGSRQQVGIGNDYTVSGATITFTISLSAGEVLLADYNY